MATISSSSNSSIVKTWVQATENKMIQRAIAARHNAYCPYSNFPVGASLLTKDLEIFSGCNYENAAYGDTICAERNAVGNGVSNGYRIFQACVLAIKDGEGYPCGSCRQVLNEFLNPQTKDMVVMIVTPEGVVKHTDMLSKLIPHAFEPHNL